MFVIQTNGINYLSYVNSEFEAVGYDSSLLNALTFRSRMDALFVIAKHMIINYQVLQIT